MMGDAVIRNDPLERLIKGVLSERFPTSRIGNVIVKSDKDNDGDDVLRITVILEEEPAKLDRDNLVSLVRYIKSKLEDVQRFEFPLMSFVSKTEAKKLKLEAA
jgi:hypothetical protein